MPRERHWSKHTFRQVAKAESGRKLGYCSVCHADMAISSSGTAAHYNSHKWYKKR